MISSLDLGPKRLIAVLLLALIVWFSIYFIERLKYNFLKKINVKMFSTKLEQKINGYL